VFQPECIGQLAAFGPTEPLISLEGPWFTRGAESNDEDCLRARIALDVKGIFSHSEFLTPPCKCY
jgi:hypothetical protein